MVNIKIHQVTMHHVRVPLKKPFHTQLQTVTERESILIEMVDVDGTVGVGECVAFTSPWYTEETVQSAWIVLEEWLIPLLMNQTFSHPDELDAYFASIKRNHMAKAAINHALWDIFAKKLNQPLWQVIGGSSQPIEAGIVVASSNEKGMYAEIESAVEKGYKRIKIKISSTSIPECLTEIIAQYPQILFFADANGAFTENTLHQLLAYDKCGFTLIEQPFSEQNNIISSVAQKMMKTPFALDESIASLQDVEEMIERQSGKIIVMKQGRVGGLSHALRIHEYCVKAGVPIWVGGMIEFGVSKAFNLAFASLPGVKFPGDFSSSSHFWHQDLATQVIKVSEGEILLSNKPGVGVNWNFEAIEKHKVRRKQFLA